VGKCFHDGSEADKGLHSPIPSYQGCGSGPRSVLQHLRGPLKFRRSFIYPAQPRLSPEIARRQEAQNTSGTKSSDMVNVLWDKRTMRHRRASALAKNGRMPPAEAVPRNSPHVQQLRHSSNLSGVPHTLQISGYRASPDVGGAGTERLQAAPLEKKTGIRQMAIVERRSSLPVRPKSLAVPQRCC